MENIFLRLLNLSISAGWLVLAITLFRFLFKKSPKWIICLLWAMVAVRLIFPFSFESALSLVPSAETVPQEIIYAKDPQIHTGIDSLNSTINPIISETLAPEPLTSANPAQILCAVAWNVWILGMIAMILYAIISYIRIRLRVRASIKKEKNVYITDNIDTPFILGVIRPKIYLPSAMDEENEKYVLAHERAHLSRLDHLWKPLGFILLSVYWFNPLMWVAYILLCRDIELACDEKVVRMMGDENKKSYSEALLSCSVRGKLIAACPLAFGEVGVKARIKSVLSYKKPAFWIIIICLILSVALAVCFLTDPVSKNVPDTVTIIDSGSEIEGVSIEIKEMELEGTQPYITVVWKNKTAEGVGFGTPFDILRYENGEWKNCRVTEAFWNAILNLMHPLSEREETYNLWHIDMTKEGLYRLEVEACLGDDNTEHKLWVDFELSNGYPLTTVRQYRAEEVIYDSPIYSSLITADTAPIWKISDVSNDLFLWEKGQSDADWIGLGAMTKKSLSKSNFDDKFMTAPEWNNGFSAEKLRKENKNAWEGRFSTDYGPYDLYILLEQEDGSMFLCVGSQNDGSSSFRCIYKLQSMEVGSEENTDIRPSLIYNGKHYVDITTGEAKLPDNVSYRGVISPDMANNTGLAGMRYFANEDEEYYIYVEHITDGKTIYKMWQSGRTYAEAEEVMRYVCYETVDFIPPSITLYPERGEYMFSCSALSSNIPMGEYTLTNDTLTLHISSTNKDYVFRVNGNNLYFDAEKSAPLPKYKYSQNSQPQHPFEDGARFGRVYDLQESYDELTQSGEGDIDGDGIEESLSLGIGPTSGIYTFTITATENGEVEYFNIFQSDYQIQSFFKDGDGKLFLRCESIMINECQTAYIYEITVEDGNIVLSEMGEEMAYWGEQGLNSSWLTRYEE